MVSRKRARFNEVKPEDFTELQTPHPYGVLPGGNQFFGPTSQASSTYGLTEESWNHMIGFLKGDDVARLSNSSMFFYVLCHQPEVWRDLCLAENKVIQNVGKSWKETYVRLQGKTCTHSPMRVLGIYSETLFRQHSCRSFHIPSQWYCEGGTLPSVNIVDMTPEKFLEQYEQPNQPVLIKGAAKSWKAFERWNDPEYLKRHTIDCAFRATSGAAPQAAQFTFAAYQDYCAFDILEEGPLYLFDRAALAPHSTLWKDFYPDLQSSCPFWDPENAQYHDLFKILGEGRRPDHTWLICGPQRSGSVFHIDPNATHAWNANIIGRKRWIFYPPSVTPPGIHPSEDGDEVTLPISIGEWLFEYYEMHRSNKSALEITAMPGDVIFVPHGWWHCAINLDPMNIAITHNYVSESNLDNVLKFLRSKRDQVSGCRDRPESIKPNVLYEEFVKELSRTHPDQLAAALSSSQWTCRAWKNEKPSTSTSSSIMEKAKTSTGFSFGFV